MSYQVLLFQSAQKDVKGLSKAMSNRVQAALEEIAKNPRGRHSKKLTAAKGVYRWRVGDFRILYEIHDANQQVHVHRVVPRKDAY